MSGAGSLPPPSSSTFPAAAADQARDRWQQALQSQVDHFWEERLKEATEIEAKDIKCSCELPLARVKRVMKLEDELQDEHELRRKICHDAPYIMAKACELFIQEVTLRACAHADENKRRTLQKHDILSAVTQTDVFDFLIDIVPRGDASRGMLPGMGAAAHHHPANSAAEGLMALNDQQTRMIQEHFMSAGGAALQQGVSAAEMTDSMRLQGMMMQQHMAMQLSDPQAAAHLQAAWQHLAAGHSHAQRPESESTPPS